MNPLLSHVVGQQRPLWVLARDPRTVAWWALSYGIREDEYKYVPYKAIETARKPPAGDGREKPFLIIMDCPRQDQILTITRLGWRLVSAQGFVYKVRK